MGMGSEHMKNPIGIVLQQLAYKNLLNIKNTF